MRRLMLLALMCLSTVPLLPACAQTPQLELPSFAGLKAKATQSVDITIGSATLGFMRWLARDENHGDEEADKVLAGLQSVRVHSYQFATDFAYSKADIDGVRAQLAGPGWSQLVHTEDKNTNENVDVYVALSDHVVKGLAVIASKPREFTIVNIVGTIDLKEVAKLQRHLRLPGPDVGPSLADDR